MYVRRESVAASVSRRGRAGVCAGLCATHPRRNARDGNVTGLSCRLGIFPYFRRSSAVYRTTTPTPENIVQLLARSHLRDSALKVYEKRGSRSARRRYRFSLSLSLFVIARGCPVCNVTALSRMWCFPPVLSLRLRFVNDRWRQIPDNLAGFKDLGFFSLSLSFCSSFPHVPICCFRVFDSRVSIVSSSLRMRRHGKVLLCYVCFGELC